MRAKIIFLLLVLALAFIFVPSVYATPATVGTSTSTTAVSNPQEQGSAFINGQYWAWFSDGTNFKCFSSSDNGVDDAWAAATNWSTMAATSANRFDVAVQNVAPFKFAYVWCRSSNAYVYFGQGELEVDGSVTWDSAGQQTVQTGLTTPFYPSIDYDGTGKAWLGYQYTYATNNVRFRVHHNSVTTGTWTSAFTPVEPLIGQTNLRGLVLGKTTEAALCIYANQSAWVSSTDIASDGTLSHVRELASDTAAGTSVTGWSATKNGNTAIMAWHVTGTNKWRYNTRVSDAWGSSSDVGATGVSGTMPPYVSVDTATGTIYVFLVNYVANSYTYFAFLGGSSTQTDVAEGTGFYDKATFQPSKQAYNSKITCIWLQSGTSPRNVRYDVIDVSVAPTVTYATIGCWLRVFSSRTISETKSATKTCLVRLYEARQPSKTITAFQYPLIRIFESRIIWRQSQTTHTSLIMLFDSRETEKIIVITLIETVSSELLRLHSGTESLKHASTVQALWLRLYEQQQEWKTVTDQESGLIKFYGSAYSWKQVEASQSSLIRLFESHQAQKIVMAILLETVAPSWLRFHTFTETVLATPSHLILVMAVLVALGLLGGVLFLAYRRKTE